jgi:hypothetical protein
LCLELAALSGALLLTVILVSVSSVAFRFMTQTDVAESLSRIHPSVCVGFKNSTSGRMKDSHAL